MIITFLRTIILYLLVVTSMRIMGKRTIGELQPNELVIAIMISDLASIPMQSTDAPLLSGIIPILTLITLEVFLSFFSLKSKKFRKILCGEPTEIVKDGNINMKNMKNLRFSRTDLMEELRQGGCDDITEVKRAVLETNGQLSILLKKENRPLSVAEAKQLAAKKNNGGKK